MSKYMKPEARVTIPKHKHCLVCATPVPFEKEYCGPACEEKFKSSERRRKYMFILVLLMFPLFFLVLTLLRGSGK